MNVGWSPSQLHLRVNSDSYMHAGWRWQRDVFVTRPATCVGHLASFTTLVTCPATRCWSPIQLRWLPVWRDTIWTNQSWSIDQPPVITNGDNICAILNTSNTETLYPYNTIIHTHLYTVSILFHTKITEYVKIFFCVMWYIIYFVMYISELQL